MEAKLEGGVEVEEDSPVDSAHSSEDSYDWRSRRKTANIIDSVKKRVAMRNSPVPEPCGTYSEEEACSPPPQSEKSLTLDEKLEELVPERKSLSPAAQQSLSLNRNKSLFKSAPTYNTLECMFGPSVSSTTSIYSAFDSNNSLYSSFRSTGSTGIPRRISEQSAKSLGLESDTFESVVDDDPEADVKQNASEKSRRHRDNSPTRPGFFKSISSPSKIINFVHGKKSSASSTSSVEDNSVRSCGEKLHRTYKEKSSSDENSPEKRRHPNFKDASDSSSYKMITSKMPTTSITLSFEEDEKTLWSESEEIAQALMSPTLKKPFRKRSGALTLNEGERPRSSSVPNSSCFNFTPTDVKSSTSD